MNSKTHTTRLSTIRMLAEASHGFKTGLHNDMKVINSFETYRLWIETTASGRRTYVLTDLGTFVMSGLDALQTFRNLAGIKTTFKQLQQLA